MNNWIKPLFLYFSAIVFNLNVIAQDVTLSGKITNETGENVFGASIVVLNDSSGIVSKSDGSYSIAIPSGKIVYLECSFLGYKSLKDSVFAQHSEKITKNFVLREKLQELEEIVIQGVQERENTLTRINMKSINQLPNTSGNIETLLKSFSNVVSGNELSSQYSVRGGNYDENLVYVNDIEIHRSMLVQSAQQEGLSFVNPDMVSTIQFSAGGFEAKYGDKMSSVLDITYEKPIKFEGSASASMLGANLHLAGISKNKKLTFNTGIRYKTSQYVLTSLEVKGEYMPRFVDVQTFVTYDLNKKKLNICFR
jgi:hypothetical protein